MKESGNKKRITKLRALVDYHRRLYHESDKPEISDEAYDSLVRELQSLEGSTDESVDSVATKVGGAVSDAFSKVQHKVRQWSLGNVFTESELMEWDERLIKLLGDSSKDLTYVVEHKLDGLKVVLEYKSGKLVRAATRGDGVVGEDVTHTVKTIQDIPLTLSHSVDLVCVGEVWLSHKEFDRINKEREKTGEQLFANPRNAAAGSLRQLDASVARSRKLSTTVYDIDWLDIKSTGLVAPTSQWDELTLLKDLGFVINPNNRQARTVQDIISYYKYWSSSHNDLPYGVDGVVMKVDSIALQRELGYTAKSPRYGMAFKFPAVQATSVVEDIQLQVGRTGVITPVAHLAPVLIDGSTVSRATLHNEDQIKRLDVRIGDTVILQKAGDIIPEILEVVKDLRPKTTKSYHFPKKVDGCGGDGSIERVPGESAYRCVTLDSDFLHRQRLYHFVSRQAFNVDGVGPRIIDLLLDHSLIAHHYDLFSLEVGDLKDLPGFKEKAAQNVIEAIDQVRSITLNRLLISLSIEHIGEETARLIANYCGSLEAIRKAEVADLSAIYGVGEVVAESLVGWLGNKENQKNLEELLKYITVINPEHKKVDGELAGKTMVFTGTMVKLTRDEAKDRARALGAQVTDSVSKKTDYVVVGADPGSKAVKAETLGVPILDETAFLKLIRV